ARLQEHHDRRGHFNKAGDLKPSVLTEAKFIGDLLGEARRLFEEIRQQSAALPADGVFRCELADGSSAFAVPAPVVAGREAPAFAAVLALEERSVEHTEATLDRPRFAPPAPARRATEPSRSEPPDGDPGGRGWINVIGGEHD